MNSRSITVAGKRFDVMLDAGISARLSRTRRRKTKPEQTVAHALRTLGQGFSTRSKGLPGTPDFVNRREGWAVFVHGCYWHHHRGCPRATVPKTNHEFWIAKFADNRRRDERAVRQLRKLGFRVLVVWECGVDTPALERRLATLVRLRGSNDNDNTRDGNGGRRRRGPGRRR